MNLDSYPTPETDAAAYDVTNADAEWGQTREKSIEGSHCCVDHARDLERRLALCRDALKSIEDAEDFSGGFISAEHMDTAREALTATAPR